MASPLLQRHSSRHRASVLSELNVTPLLDLAFVLLVIFMITAPLLRQGMEISLPGTKTPQTTSLPDNQLTVAVDAQGGIKVNGAAMQSSQLAPGLKILSEQNPDLAVVVETNRSLPVQSLVEVLEQIKLAGIKRMGIVTRQESSP